MAQKQLVVESYLHRYQKFVALYLLIITSLGALNFLFYKDKIFEIIFGVLLLMLSCYLLVSIIGKKGLLIKKDILYKGIVVNNTFLIKQKIDTTPFNGFNFERKKKNNSPGLLEYSGMTFFSNYHECIIYLVKNDSKNKNKLISLTNFNKYEKVRDFLLRWTRLKE